VEENDRFELMAPAPLNLVCFRHKAGDAFNQALLERLNASGELYFTHTKLNGAYTLRMSIGQEQTETRHVERAWDSIRETATEMGK
jgi:aromatic-L-amino-acid decarboxylase